MPDESPSEADKVGRTVHRSYMISLDDAEWLRTAAFLLKTSQNQLVRQAIRDLRAKLGEPGPENSPENVP
jgi:hypothetical protein